LKKKIAKTIADNSINSMSEIKARSISVADNDIITSIVIPTLNPDERLSNCITFLEKQSEKRFEVIIINNGSNFNFLSLDHSIEHFSVIKNNTNSGFSKAVNQGIRASKGKYVILLNDDTYPVENWLDSLIKTAKSDPKIGLVTSKLRFNTPPYLIQNTGLCINNKYYYLVSRDSGRSEPLAKDGSEVYAPCGAALLIKKKFIEDVGFFDEDFFAYGEDIDIGIRGQIKDWKCIYSSGAEVFHDHSMTGKQYSTMKSYFTVRNGILLAIKTYPLNELIKYLLMKNMNYWFHLKYIMQSKIIRKKKNNTIKEIDMGVPVTKLILVILKAHFDALIMSPKMLRKRKEIWKNARITKKDFSNILRKYKIHEEDNKRDIEILSKYG